MRPLFFVALVVMNLFWAATYVVFKGLAPYLNAGEIATLRYTVAALTLGLLWPWLPGAAPRGLDLIKTAAMGVVVFVVANRLMVAGVHRGQASDASVLMALEPLVTSVAAALFLRERITGRRWSGFALGMIGVALLAQIWRPDFHLPGLIANVMIIGSFICETPFSIVGKPIIERAGLFKVVAVSLGAGAAVNLLLDGHSAAKAALLMPLGAWLLILYLGVICTVVGYSLWYVVIRETEVNVTALTIFVQPVAGVLLAVLALGEPPHWGQLWGSLAIGLGLLAGLPGRRSPHRGG